MHAPATDTALLRGLADRAELADLAARVGRWLDERRFDDVREVYTEDAVVVTAGGRAEGADALAAQARRGHASFARTQHVITNVLSEVDGDRATVRAALTVTFVSDASDPAPARTMGETYHFTAVRTGAGWRFTTMTADAVWRSAA